MEEVSIFRFFLILAAGISAFAIFMAFRSYVRTAKTARAFSSNDPATRSPLGSMAHRMKTIDDLISRKEKE